MKKVLSLVLACVMLLSLASISATAEQELKTIRVLGIDNSRMVGDKTVYISDLKNGTYGESKMWAELEAQLAARGIKLEVELVRQDQYQVVAQTRLASGLKCDYMALRYLDDSTLFQMAEVGRLQDLNSIIDNYSDGTAKEFFYNGNGQQDMAKNSLQDGKLYWFTSNVNGYLGDINNHKGSTRGAMIRYDWLQALGLDLPTTTDELFDALVAFQENDMNGNGEKDEVVSVALDNFQNGISEFYGIGAGGFFYYHNTVTGELECAWTAPYVKEYFAFMQKLHNAGLLDTSLSSNEKQAANQTSLLADWQVNSNKEPVVPVQEGAAPAYYVPFVCKDPTIDIDPYIERNDGPAGAGGGGVVWGFTNECDPEAAAALLDYITSDDYYLLTEWGIEGYTFNYDENGKPVKFKGDSIEQIHWFNRYGLWALGIFPRIERVDRAEEIARVIAAGKEYGYPEGYVLKGEMSEKLMLQENALSDALLAVATPEEQEKINEWYTDLDTYSDELAMKLILSQASLDDWDSYMADFERLHLAEFMELQRGRFERAKVALGLE